jgi:hypothetical protein
MLEKNLSSAKVNKNWYNLTMDTKEQPLSDEPVAYDVDGQPLYSHPHPANEPAPVETRPQVVQVTRQAEPEKPIVNASTKLKHERSSQLYPNLNLSDGEYVISAVKRHSIGLFLPFLIGFILVFISAIILVNYKLIAESFQVYDDTSLLIVALPAALFIILVILSVCIVYSVYTNNKFFLTNESVIQEIQKSVFSKYEQTVSLMDIEDASFTQLGIVQQFFDYGSIRLSTEGDETTYRFTYVAGPKQHIATLTNAIEAFKNGRPVENKQDG